jgi:hypothetical protein
MVVRSRWAAIVVVVVGLSVRDSARSTRLMLIGMFSGMLEMELNWE